MAPWDAAAPSGCAVDARLTALINSLDDRMRLSLSGTVERVGVSGLYCFSLMAITGVSGAAFGLFLMLCAWMASLRTVWPCIRRDPVFWIVLLCGVYLLVSATVAARIFPDTADHQWWQAKQWGYLVLLPVVAWWLGGSGRRILVAFGLFCLGGIWRMLNNTPWQDLGDWLGVGMPPWGFGLWHISFSAYLAVILLGVILFSPRLVRGAGSYPLGGLTAAGLVVVALICLVGILVGQSRGTWLAMLVVFPPVLFMYFRRLQQSRWAMGRGYLLVAVVLASLLSAIAVLPAHDALLARLSAEWEVYAALLTGDISQVPITSVGARIHLYHHGVNQWLESPWFGWGAGSQAYLIQQTGLFTGAYVAPHYHNIVLEILLRFGLLGLGLIMAILSLVMHALWRGYVQGTIAVDWYYFFLGVFLFSLVWGMADIRIIRWDYRNFTLLVLGAAYSLGVLASARREQLAGLSRYP
ncbi:hypothetical protein CKO35_04050 [Ectothiorhodospira shaposhnikovii]|uniref:O-antigen ligase family protein n=1 Tax=Ectothiorhodospira shaposhnikovii TaxID=1054 RepID=UPI0019038689|nr:O-antigen ligase family protein [Ectothiorhodospira shaposhnikovii]MBK1672481.1 hypothetical protein [Ectothiorhodospira shaposhnikovii]